MAKIKLTKTELKTQRDALSRFTRYLPTLQLKKQQLQMEAQRLRGEHRQLQQRLEDELNEIERWIRLLDPNTAERIGEFLQVAEWRVTERNVAGVDVPAFEELRFHQEQHDLFAEPMWFDDVINAAKKILELKLRLRIAQQQLEAIENELRVTTQRVNLFEKVKIPEAEENIRTIQIFLGDQQVAAVGRAKIAKRKTQAL